MIKCIVRHINISLFWHIYMLTYTTYQPSPLVKSIIINIIILVVIRLICYSDFKARLANWIKFAIENVSKHLTRLRLLLCLFFCCWKTFWKFDYCAYLKSRFHIFQQNIFHQFDACFVCVCVFCFDKYLQRTEIFTLIALTSVGILEIHLELPAVGQSATRRMINKLIKIYCATLEKILLNSTNSLARSLSLFPLLSWQFVVRQSCRSMVVSTV